MAEEPARAFSGRPGHDITVDAIRAGRIGPDDVRIHPDVLERQALTAERHGNPQLADNLRRAAELARLDDGDVMRIYEALRPFRSTAGQLEELAAWLSSRGATRTAALVREARDVYTRRGLTAR